MKHMLMLLSLLGTLVLATGSVTAGERPVLDLTNGDSQQAATLEIESKEGRFGAFALPDRLRVFAVDDVRLKKPALGRFSGYRGELVSEVLLRPGKHRVLLHAKGKLGCGWAYQWFVAEPGKRYIAKFKFDRLLYKVWIEDVTSGKPVGGLVLSIDEPEPKPRSQDMYDATTLTLC